MRLRVGVKNKKIKMQAVTRVLLWIGVAAPLLFIIIFTADGSTRSDYNQLRHWISHLSLGERGWLGTLNLLMIGAALWALSVGFARALSAGRGSKWAPRLVWLAGLGFIVASIFKQDPGLGYPSGITVSTGSMADNIHGLAALLLFSSLVALGFVLAKRFTGKLRWFSLLASWVTIVSFVACSVLVSLDYAKVWVGAPSGLLERIALVSVLLYVSVVSYHLARQKV